MPLGAQAPDRNLERINSQALRDQATRNWGAAEQLYQRGIELAARAPEHRNELAVLYGNLGTLYREEHRYADSERSYRLAYEAAKLAFGPTSRRAILMQNALGEVCFVEGRFLEAKAMFREALVAFEGTRGHDPLDTAPLLNNLAAVEDQFGSRTHAEELLRKAACIYAERAPDHPSRGVTLTNLAEEVQAGGDGRRAAALLGQAVTVLEREGGTERLANTLSILGQLQTASRDFPAAEVTLGRAQRVVEQMGDENRPDGAMVWRSLAKFYAAAGKPSEAAPLLDRVVRIYKRFLAPDHPTLLASMQEYAVLLRATGHKREAGKLEEELRLRQQRAHSNLSDAVVDVRALSREQYAR